jgi:hypothetical protein
VTLLQSWVRADDESAMPEVICEACGWMAVTASYAADVWAEHVAGCPAPGGAVRYAPPLPPLPPAPPKPRCDHRPVQRHVATLPGGRKRYATVCIRCGRHVPPDSGHGTKR